MNKITIGLVWVLLVGALNASAQEATPFGLRMGMNVAEVQRLTGAVVEKDDRFYFDAKRVPSPHDAFESYQLLVSPTLGLCKIIAIGKDIEQDAYGSSARQAFQSLTAGLTSKYGKPANEYDFLKAGSIWDESREWAMAVRQNERTLSNYWGTDGQTLLAPVKTINLEVKATSSSTTYLVLVYDFANIEKCINERNASKNSIL